MRSDENASPTSASHIARDSNTAGCGIAHNRKPFGGIRSNGVRLAPNPKHATCRRCQRWLAAQTSDTQTRATSARWFDTAPVA